MLLNAPMLIDVQHVEGEIRFADYDETDAGQLLAVGRPNRMSAMNRKTPEMPKFKNESEEADWWATGPGERL